MASQPLLSDRLLHCLLSIHKTPARLIATPSTIHALNAGGGGQPASSGAALGAAAKRRASVAIILRIRPQLGAEFPVGCQSQGSFPSSPGSIAEVPLPENVPPPAAPSASGLAALPPADVPAALENFFAQPWVRVGTPELLFIKRAARASDRWSSHVAFPGGRMEADDEDGLFTALRETWEEVGLDLAEKDYLRIGQLDDREITTSLGKRLLMILSPHVFLYTGREAPVPDLQPEEVASAHWVPLVLVSGPAIRWGDVRIDISSRLAPRSPTIRWVLRLLVGDMHFQSVLLPNEPCAVGTQAGVESGKEDLKLWGLTLGMTLDLVSLMSHYPSIQPLSPATYPLFPPQAPFKTESAPASAGPSSPNRSPADHKLPLSVLESWNALPHAAYAAPSMTSIFPRFTYPDINFWIWVFGWRYRRLVRRWNERQLPPPHAAASRSSSWPPPGGLALSKNHADRRVSWAGMALGQFYTAVRKALVVAIVGRAAGLLGLIGALMWYFKRLEQRKRRLYIGC